jgi:hypothetical protein
MAAHIENIDFDITLARREDFNTGSIRHRNFLKTAYATNYAERAARFKINIFGEFYQLHGKVKKKGKAVPLHAMEAFGGRGGTAPTHSRPRH